MCCLKSQISFLLSTSPRGEVRSKERKGWTYKKMQFGKCISPFAESRLPARKMEHKEVHSHLCAMSFQILQTSQAIAGSALIDDVENLLESLS